METKGSARWSYDKVDWLKLLKGLGIGLVGATVTWLGTVSAGGEFGPWTPFVAMGAATVANMLRKWAANNQ